MGCRHKSGAVHLSRLPKGTRQAAARRIEKLQQRGPAADLMFTPEKALAKARQREVLLHYLDRDPNRIAAGRTTEPPYSQQC